MHRVRRDRAERLASRAAAGSPAARGFAAGSVARLRDLIDQKLLDVRISGVKLPEMRMPQLKIPDILPEGIWGRKKKKDDQDTTGLDF